METLKVNGHVLKGDNGIIFCNDGSIFNVTKEVFNVVIPELLKNKEIRVSENLTLIYD